jgi:hypothetical protein
MSDTTLTQDVLAFVDRLDKASLSEIKEAKDYCRDLGHDYATRASRRRLYKKLATLLRAELPKGVKIK